MNWQWTELIDVGGMLFEVEVAALKGPMGAVVGYTMVLPGAVGCAPVSVGDDSLEACRPRMVSAIATRMSQAISGVAGQDAVVLGDYTLEQLVVVSHPDVPQECRAFVIGMYDGQYVVHVHPNDLPDNASAFPACVLVPAEALRPATDEEAEDTLDEHVAETEEEEDDE